jgi:hypothetical protein
MLTKRLLALIAVAAMCGCISETNQNKTLPYNVTMLLDYNASLCGGTGYHYQNDSFNTGVRIRMKDAETGAPLDGKVNFLISDGGGSMSLFDSYSCEEQVNSQDSVISVYSPGYSPVSFEFSMPKNQLATIEVPMQKGCANGLSCFDNVAIISRFNAHGNQSMFEQQKTETEDYFYQYLFDYFQLNKSDISITCAECMMDRGGFIRAKGVYKKDAPFELYYHWGWCAPSGGDCGWGLCFTSSDESLFRGVENLTCSRIYVVNETEDNSEPGISRRVIQSDLTNVTREECAGGSYSKQNGVQKTISLIQNSYPMQTFVTSGNASCLEA